MVYHAVHRRLVDLKGSVCIGNFTIIYINDVWKIYVSDVFLFCTYTNTLIIKISYDGKLFRKLKTIYKDTCVCNDDNFPQPIDK